MLRGKGRIPVTVNGGTAVGVTNVSFDETTNQTVKTTADGSNVRTEGRAKYKWSLDGVLLEDKQVIVGQIEAARAQGELNIGYVLGSEEFLLIDCGKDSVSVSSDSDGTGEFKISGVATDRLQVR